MFPKFSQITVLATVVLASQNDGKHKLSKSEFQNLMNDGAQAQREYLCQHLWWGKTEVFKNPDVAEYDSEEFEKKSKPNGKAENCVEGTGKCVCWASKCFGVFLCMPCLCPSFYDDSKPKVLQYVVGKTDPIEKYFEYDVMERRIGRGAAGLVNKAWRKSDGKCFAVKKLVTTVKDPSGCGFEEHVAKGIRAEILAMHWLNHKNILKVETVFEDDRYVYIVMPLVEGKTLQNKAKQIRRHVGNPEGQMRRYIRQIVDTMDHMHTQGVYHNDLKPENIMVDKDDNIIILDFGHATFGPIVDCKGTAGLFAPENLFYGDRGMQKYLQRYKDKNDFEMQEPDCHPAARDIWLIGATMYVAFTKIPFMFYNYDEARAIPIKEYYRKLLDHLRLGRDDPKIIVDEMKTCISSAQREDKKAFKSEGYVMPGDDCLDFIAKCCTASPDKRITFSAMKEHPFLDKPREI